jgi:hypothetical protein
MMLGCGREVELDMSRVCVGHFGRVFVSYDALSRTFHDIANGIVDTVL